MYKYQIKNNNFIPQIDWPETENVLPMTINALNPKMNNKLNLDIFLYLKHFSNSSLFLKHTLMKTKELVKLNTKSEILKFLSENGVSEKLFCFYV